jgi:hypothetical protein
LLVCCPQPGKAKSREILEALRAGYQKAASCTVDRRGIVAFFGVVGLERDFLDVGRDTDRDYLYGDNALVDGLRGKFFRFARNALQISTLQPPDYRRRIAQRLFVRPWQRDGRHIVIVEQSWHFLRLCGIGDDWFYQVASQLAQVTDRPLRVRRWRRDKGNLAATLQEDLRGAWALVTHMSAAANEALLAGVPVFVTGPCAATPLASGPLSAIEDPRYPDGREEWAAGLANSHWTMDELRDGTAWRRLYKCDNLA